MPYAAFTPLEKSASCKEEIRLLLRIFAGVTTQIPKRMEHKKPPANGRILSVDALRGFAVMGIVLLHNIEHFNFYSFPEAASPLLANLNQHLWDLLFFLFSGKAYAIFALLFGFTFYLQSHNCEKRGTDFRNRYMWRLVLLLGFGFINASFFPGEILVLYALLGFVLIPVRHLSDKTVAWIAVFLMLQPLEWGKVAYALIHSEANPQQMIFSLADVYPQLGGSSFWEMVKVNFVTGQLASLNWAWCYGRVFQTASLFMFGMLLGRKGLFCPTDGNHAQVTRFWLHTCLYALPCAVLLYFLKDFIYTQIKNPFLEATMQTIWNSWYNLAFMLVIVSGFLLLYWANKGKVMQLLVPYGKMSLTDYVTQSIVGSFLYFGYGLELHRHLGTTASLLMGIAFFLLQLLFAHWWFRHFKRGPLETVWHRLTWMGAKKA